MKWWFLLPAAALASGCGTLGKPPLPKFAVGEAPRPPAAEEAATARLREADVIYFGLTKRSATDRQPAWRIVESLQRSGQRVALGWADLPLTQQPLLDRWQRHEISTQSLLKELSTADGAQWLRQALRPDLLQAALGAPRELLRKIRAGETLSLAERGLLPQGFRPSPEEFDNFLDRAAASPRLRRYDLPRLYRAHLAAEQTIAENIIQFHRANPKAKLIVILPDEVLINPHDVAEYVAQKEPLRQLILDRSGALPSSRAQLLAAARRGAFEIKNRAPRTGRHDCRFPAPRLRT